MVPLPVDLHSVEGVKLGERKEPMNSAANILRHYIGSLKQSGAKASTEGRLRAEQTAVLIRLVVLISLLPLLWWDVISPESKLLLQGLTVLISGYILVVLFLLPRLRYRPRKDLFVALDIVAVAALVYSTGGINSSLLFLLYLPVVAAAVRLDLRTTVLSATLVSIIAMWMWVVEEGGLPALTSTALRVGFFTFGSLLVALFFGMLAQETRLSLDRATLNRILDEKLGEATNQLRRRLSELEAFYTLSRCLAGATGIAAVLETIVEAAQQQMDAPSSAIFLYESLGRGLTLARVRGITAEESGPIMRACADRLGEHSTEAVLVETPDGGLWTRGVCMPIVAAGRLIGAICAGGDKAWTYRDQALSGFVNIADQAGVALERAYLQEDLQRLALADPTARLYSQDQLGQILREEVRRATQLAVPFVLMKLKVLSLANISTSLGEAAAELFLKRAGAIILESARRVDVVAQGADGVFFVMLPMMNGDAAKKFATELQGRLWEDATAARLLSAPHGPDSRAGIAVFPNDAQTAQGLYVAADGKLEAAEVSDPSVYAREPTPH